MTIVAGLYTQSFRESHRANAQARIYEDANFIMSQLAREIQNGMIDYDEYYSWNVAGATNYGQKYGTYYSSFFYPGSDQKLGFDCNDGTRNLHEAGCTPLRKTLDKNVGSNPFIGKYTMGAGTESDYFAKEDAFCGNVSYNVAPGAGAPGMTGICPPANKRTTEELYLISADGRQKTILARERIGGTDNAANGVYALSILRMKWTDTNGDSIDDNFVCADDFQCTSGLPDCGPANVPRDRIKELNPTDADFRADCDNAAVGFSKDFVPIIPLTVNVTNLKFYITPVENPHYAFAETDAQQQPRVTVVMTVTPNLEKLGVNESFQPLTFTETVPSFVLTPVPAPVLEQP